MPVPLRQIVQYFRSRDFGKDYANFARRNPVAAAYQLRLIVEQLNENLVALGTEANAEALAIQAHFLSGEMPIPRMIELVTQYATTIEDRWPSIPELHVVPAVSLVSRFNELDSSTEADIISAPFFATEPMFASVRRLVNYYRSPDFAADHAHLDRYDPLAAEQQRYAIIGNLNDNLATEGITPTPTELAVQARFIAGEMPLAHMLEQIELYVASIGLRWPE